MRAGQTSLKASLNRFKIVSTSECKCGDGLETDDYIFWVCKLYEEQQATMIAILSENRKKENRKVSYRAVKTRGKKICARSLIIHKQNSNIYLKSSIRYVRK
jgi:hypothetical protein